MVGVGAGILLLLLLRKRKNANVTTLDGEIAGDGNEGDMEKSGGGAMGGGGGGAIGGGGGIGATISGIFGGGGGGSVTPPPVVINNPVINTLRPMPIAQSQVSSRPYTSSISRPYTTSVDSRPVATTSPNTTQAVSATPSRANFLTFDGSFRSPSNLDFDGSIID